MTAPSPLPPIASIPLRLSQGHLNLLATCPRKFQHTYLEQLAAPNDPEQQERQTQGSLFHLLMQQWQLGLPVEPLLQQDPQLQRWFTAFMTAAPEILMLDSTEGNVLRQSEHARTLEIQGYLITVVYDLLLLSESPQSHRQAKILDWKTYPRPRKTHWLAQNWQARLYPFVLAETSHYAPEQISMVYWFFQSRGQQADVPEPQSLQLAYDRDKHERTRHDLMALLAQLTDWLGRYQQGEPFPQVRLEAEQCSQCNYAVRCDRLADAQADQCSALPHLADIQEIPL